MKLRDTLTHLGLREDDGPAEAPADPAPGFAQAPAAPFRAPMTGSADPGMVAALRASVLGSSAVVARFMANVEIARAQFPADETARLRAALAFTGVAREALAGELTTTVAAALTHARHNTEVDRAHARDAAVGSLERDLAAATEGIRATQAKILELQQSIVTQQATVNDIQSRVAAAEGDLQHQDAAVNASLAQVEQDVAALAQTLSRL